MRSEFWTSRTPILLIILCKQDDWSCSICNSIINGIILRFYDYDRNKASINCFISVIGYGHEVKEFCLGSLKDLYNSPIRIETSTKKISDGNGDFIDIEVNQPLWIEPIEDEGDNIHNGFEMAQQLVKEWIADKPQSPRVLILDIGCELSNLDSCKKSEDFMVFGIYNHNPKNISIYDCISQNCLNLYDFLLAHLKALSIQK